MAAYYAIITQDEGKTSYGLTFYDFCCLTNADTLEDLEMMAKEALGQHLDCTKSAGFHIPTPSDFRTVAAEALSIPELVGVMLVTLPK